MARHTSRHAARRTWLGGFAVCLIVAFSGYLLVTNVRVNRTATVTSDTADLVEQRVEHVDQLQKDITDLTAQIVIRRKWGDVIHYDLNTNEIDG